MADISYPIANNDDFNQHKLDYVDFVDEIAGRVKNLISNGNFANDTNNDGIADGFRANGVNVTQPRIENNTQYWTPQTTLYSGSMQSSRHTLLKDHTYYVKANITNINSTYMHDHENNLVHLSYNLLDGNWTSTFTIGEETSTGIIFSPRESNVECSISNVILVDLTTTFGAGKEPDVAYLDYLFNRVGAPSWFEVANLTDFSKKPIMTARELEVYDTENELPAGNVNDVLLGLNDGIVKAVRGKNLYNPDNNVEGTIQQEPLIQIGQKQKIDTINNPSNHVTQKIKITNTDDVTLTNVTVYSITDLQDRVIVRRGFIGGNVTTIASSEIQLEKYYLWVSLRDTNVGLAQVEMGSEATSYEPYTPVKAVYANGVKLFDYPLEVSQSEDKKKELYDLAKMALENDTLAEKIMYLTNNAEYSNLTTESEPKDSQVIPLTKTDEQKMILHLHKRPKEEGFGTTNNAYLPNAKDNFSDVRITADNGEVLPYRVIYKTNDFDIVPYDWTRTSSKASATFKDSKGDLYQSDGSIRKSIDKGNTWTELPAFSEMRNPSFNLIAKDDTMYFSYNNKLYRSEAPYTDYQEVLNLDPDGIYAPVHITGKSLVQHPDGELFCGLYQTARNINIYKSNDNGLTWELSADWGDSYQHVHGMFVDEYTGAVYAGLDGGGGVLKTTDKGETWVDLREQNPNLPQSTDYGVRYADPSGYRLLGGETPIVGGHSIIKTYDDETFYPVLSDGISVNYVVKMGDVLFATGSGAYGFRNGAIYISRDDAETWESVYRTAPLLDLWSANDGYRYMEQISENEIFVGPQSFSRPPLRIFGSGNYAEVLVDIPAGTESLTVESGHGYPNELPIHNNSEFTGEKLVHFELNENGNVIKELVSGELFEDNFEWAGVGKHLSYFYPYITSPLNEKSALLKSLSGYLVDSSTFDTSQGVTISFWAKLSSGSRFLLFENETGDKLEIVNGYQLHLNNSNVVSFNYPTIPEPFQKHDLLISNDGSISVYTNGLLRTMSGTRGSELLNALSNGSQIEFLRNISSNDEDAIQHFVIRKGMVDEGQLLAEYNAGITDNI